MDLKRRVVIIGGGFAGIKTARDLARDRRFTVTLISDRPHFEYHAALYRSATGRSPLEVVVPLSAIFRATPIRVVEDRIVSIDQPASQAIGSGGARYGFDYLVVAVGSTVNLAGLGAARHRAYTLHDMASALELKAQIHAQSSSPQAPHNYAVIGAGPSGVELAAELIEYVRQIQRKHQIITPCSVELIEASPRILPELPERLARAAERRLRKLGVTIYTSTTVKAKGDAFELPQGSQDTHTLIWTAGASLPALCLDQPKLFPAQKRIAVDRHLRVRPTIYVVGDAAETAFAGWAQTALYDGSFAASQIQAELSGTEPPEYKPRPPVAAIPVGSGWCALVVNGLQITGLAGWLLRRASDLDLYRHVLPLRLAIRAWLGGNRHEETCPICKDSHL